MPHGAKCTVISVDTQAGVHNIDYVGFCKQENARISGVLLISATLWPNVGAGIRFELPDYPYSSLNVTCMERRIRASKSQLTDTVKMGSAA